MGAHRGLAKEPQLGERLTPGEEKPAEKTFKGEKTQPPKKRNPPAEKIAPEIHCGKGVYVIT